MERKPLRWSTALSRFHHITVKYITEEEGKNETRRVQLEEALRFARVRGMPGRIGIQDSRADREETGEHCMRDRLRQCRSRARIL